MLSSVLIFLLFFVVFHFSLFEFFLYFCFFVFLLSFDLSNFLNGFYVLNKYVYMDSICGLMIFLSIFIMFCVFLMNYITKNVNVLFLLSLMIVFLFLCFLSNYVLMMYISFEVVFVPLIFLILYKGSSPERFSATVNMFIYTFFGSLLFLLFLMVMDMAYVVLLSKLLFLEKNMSFLFLLVFLVFLIKIPMYFTHLWLPKAHVQASVEISMLLAGILLKLGGFGLIRLFYMFNMAGISSLMLLLMVINIVGGVFVSMICIVQVDLKKLIAYSSVSHMGLMLSGLLSLSMMGLSGSVLMMVSHGFCSSGLFFMGNMYYERNKSRNLILFKGIISLFPVMSVYWLLFIFMNMGVPPFMNFMSEVLLIISVLKKSLVFVFFLGLVMMLTVFFCLSLFLYFGHGLNMEYSVMQEDNFLDFFIVNIHLFFLFVYLLKVSFLVIF